MKGDYVIVRAFGDKPLVRRVWSSSPEAVYVCSAERYAMLTSGEDERYPIGFPRECVYEYDEAIVSNFGDSQTVSPELWDTLIVWHGDLDGVGQKG